MASPPRIELVVLKALMDGEVIEVDEFSERHDFRRGSVASVLSILARNGFALSQKVNPIGKNGARGAILRYSLGDESLIKARLIEIIGPPEYDFESVNRAMQFGQPADIPSVLMFKHVLLEGVEPKDPTEVDYIPQLNRG